MWLNKSVWQKTPVQFQQWVLPLRERWFALFHSPMTPRGSISHQLFTVRLSSNACFPKEPHQAALALPEGCQEAVVRHGAVESPLPGLLGTMCLGAWENASELLSSLEQPGRCSLPSTVWHRPWLCNKIQSNLLQSHRTSLRRLTAPQHCPIWQAPISHHTVFYTIF